MTSKLKEGVMQGVFTLCACVSILAVALICIFLFANGVPTLFKIGPLKFLLGTTWKPGNDIFGILPMILGSIYVTAGAILVGVPIGLLTAIYMSKFAPPRINKVMLPAVQLLAGIPSVVYGFFGMIVLVPAVQAMVKSPFFKTVLHVKSGKGMSLFTAAVLLGIMILPTIITVSKTSLDAVPNSYYEGSLALARRMSAACSTPCCPPQNPACCRQSSSALAAPSVRRWPSSWSRATRPGCPRACSRACAR